jgi:hypothetical protein
MTVDEGAAVRGESRCTVANAAVLDERRKERRQHVEAGSRSANGERAKSPRDHQGEKRRDVQGEPVPPAASEVLHIHLVVRLGLALTPEKQPFLGVSSLLPEKGWRRRRGRERTGKEENEEKREGRIEGGNGRTGDGKRSRMQVSSTSRTEGDRTRWMSAIENLKTSDQIIPRMSLRLPSTMSVDMHDERSSAASSSPTLLGAASLTLGSNICQMHAKLLDLIESLFGVLEALDAMIRGRVVAAERRVGEDFLWSVKAQVSSGRRRLGDMSLPLVESAWCHP